MHKTGVFATDEEKAKLQKLAREAASTPVLLVGGVDTSATAWERVRRECHETALAHGLPEITGYYGLTQDGEFVKEG